MLQAFLTIFIGLLGQKKKKRAVRDAPKSHLTTWLKPGFRLIIFLIRRHRKIKVIQPSLTRSLFLMKCARIFKGEQNQDALTKLQGNKAYSIVPSSLSYMEQILVVPVNNAS